MKKHLLTLLTLAALTSATLAQVPSYVPSNGLVGWWPFNGNANDQSGNGNNGTVNGATLTTDRFGNANAAYNFDGNDSILMNNLSSQTNWSISSWYRSPISSGFALQYLFGFGNQAVSNYGLPGYGLTGANQTVGCNQLQTNKTIITDASTECVINYITNYQLNTWYHIVIMRQGTSYTVYENGTLVWTGTMNPIVLNKLKVGSRLTYYSFNGKIDDIGIWNRVLTSCEVQQIYTATLPSISAVGSTTFCTGGSVTLSAQGTGSFLWSNGATSQSITVSQGGNYSVTVTNNGCSTTTGVTTVTVNPTPTASITPQGNTTFCQGGFVVLQAAGGGTYQWNTGAQSSSINVSQGGTYTVQVSQNGCSSQAQQQVTVNQLPSVSLQPISALCANANAVQLSGGSPAGGSYTVNGTPATSFDPSQTGSGQQTVVYSYTDGNGCSNTATQSATVNAVPSVNLSGLNTAYLPTDAPVQLNGSPAGGVFNGTGVSNGQFDPAAAGLGTHGVQYVVVGANGCVGSSGLCTTVDLNTGSGIGLDNGGNGVEVYPNPSNGLFTVVIDGMDGIVQLSVMDIRGREVASQSLTATGRTTHNIDLSGFANGVYTLQIQSAAGVSGMKLVKE
jgi:hypothetical protein